MHLADDITHPANNVIRSNWPLLYIFAGKLEDRTCCEQHNTIIQLFYTDTLTSSLIDVSLANVDLTCGEGLSNSRLNIEF